MSEYKDLKNHTYAVTQRVLKDENMKSSEEEITEALYKILLADWNNFKMLYKGTGAKYITLERLTSYLGIK